MASSSPGFFAVRGANRRASSEAALRPPAASSRICTSQSTGSGSIESMVRNPSSRAAIASSVRPRPAYASASIWYVFGSFCFSFASTSCSAARA